MTAPTPIRLFLVEDQQLVREGLKGLLQLCLDIQLVGEAADGVQALERIQAEPPDVVLSDMRMPRLDGIGLIRALAARQLAVPVLLLTTFDDRDAFDEATRAGAKGFLLKAISMDTLADAVREVAAGGTALRPGLTERATRPGATERAFEGLPDPEPLSPKELQVLRLVASGRSNTEIATLLGNSEGVIKNHCSAVFAKMGVRDRTQAVLRAIDLGWI
jgi:DNA-binding NarL/FixJ family response regulator